MLFNLLGKLGIQTILRWSWFCISVFTLLISVGCSDKERRRVRHAFEDIHDFHVTTVVTTATLTNALLSDPSPTKSRESVYVDAPKKVQAQDDKNRIKDFIDGYYANNERAIFTFDVTIKSFAIHDNESLSLIWSVVTALTDDKALQKCILEERNRLRDALSERDYYYPQGISVTVNVARSNGSLSQIWGTIRW
jgi:hypothetical protein